MISMKVCKTDVNKISLHSIILQLQLTLELSQFKEILSVYSDLLVLVANYSFIFENSSSEIQALKENPVSVETALITVDPIRDGHNWYSYVLNDPVNYIDLWGLETNDIRPIQPYNQRSKELSDIANLEEGGCYFMSCLFVAQDYAKTNLTANEIKSIVNKTMNKAIDEKFKVINPDVITNTAFKILGIDRTATYGWGAEHLEGQTQIPDYYIVKGTTILGNTHFEVQNNYDPYQTGDGIKAPIDGCTYDFDKDIILIPVYIH